MLSVFSRQFETLPASKKNLQQKQSGMGMKELKMHKKNLEVKTSRL